MDLDCGLLLFSCGERYVCSGGGLRGAEAPGPRPGHAYAELAGGSLDGLLPAHRSRGIARTMISVVIEHAREAGAETVMLLCRLELVPLWTQLGWRHMFVPVTFRQPAGPRPCPLSTMTYDLADLPHPTVSVDLQGLPF